MKKISKEINEQLKDIGIDMLPQFVEDETCPICGATTKENCKCPEECESCSG